MDQDNDDKVDIHEFLEFKLVELGHCDQKVIKKIKKQFKKLDVDDSGFLDSKDLLEMNNNKK
jgi:Ca2+-binding EF-hand superfamily protein